MRRRSTIFALSGAVTVTVAAAPGVIQSTPAWPPPPDTARVEFVREIRCADLKPDKGLFGSVLRIISGASEDAHLQAPFAIVSVGDRLYATCQDIPAVVEIDPESNRFRLHTSEQLPFQSPVALCKGGNDVFITDSGSAVVYRFDGEDVTPFITEGLRRPTGIAWLSGPGQLYIVDTGQHRVEIFDKNGKHVGTLGERGSADAGFNYPTFAASHGDVLLVNDTLNYQIKLFSAKKLIAAIGGEGDGPGTFARPKGIAVDPSGHIYVVDGLFDNVQVFDSQGRLLLVVGSAGEAPGEFWSPAGIDIAGDLIYVADTFNNRIQVLRRVGG